MSRSVTVSGQQPPRTGAITIVPTRRGQVGRLLKRVAQAAALVWVSPRLAVYRLSSAVWGRERAFLVASESLAAIPGQRGVYCRQAFYGRTLESCGRDVYFGWLSSFSKPQATIGDGAYIGRRCGVGLAHIGAEVMLADGVQLLSGSRQHSVTPRAGGSYQASPQVFEEIAIGDGAWLGAGSIVMADVGSGAVVGAGAVVVEPVPGHAVAVGVPARVVKRLAPTPT